MWRGDTWFDPITNPRYASERLSDTNHIRRTLIGDFSELLHHNKVVLL